LKVCFATLTATNVSCACVAPLGCPVTHFVAISVFRVILDLVGVVCSWMLFLNE